MVSKSAIKNILKDYSFFVPLFRINRFFKLRSIPIEKIRCQKKAFSVLLNFGGKTIDNFPPCQFFKTYMIDPKKAHNDFCKWMHDCLYTMDAWKICNSVGGWSNGSLIQIIRELHHENQKKYDDFSNADPVLVKMGIEQKVNYYFSLFRSLRDNGFNKANDPMITYQLDNEGYYILENGHHRVSALKALGYKKVNASRMK
jgi:hypothetical protein